MTIYVDTTSGQLVISPNDIRRCLPPGFTVGDIVPITLAFLQRNPQPLNTGYPTYNYLDFHSSAVVLSLGPLSNVPNGGTFNLTFSSDTVSDLPWNIDSYALELALNALASIVTAGGVIVDGDIGGPFYITFNENGEQVAFTTTDNSLTPAASATIVQGQTGTANVPSIQVVGFSVSSPALISTWTAQSAAAITVTSISGTVIQRVLIPQGTYGGTFTLTWNGQTTAAIPFNAQLDVVAAALQALSGMPAGVSVWPGQNYWDITIPGGTHVLTGTATGLIIPLTLTGSLDLTPQAVADLLEGSASALVPFFIQTTEATILTVFSGSAQLFAAD